MQSDFCDYDSIEMFIIIIIIVCFCFSTLCSIDLEGQQQKRWTGALSANTIEVLLTTMIQFNNNNKLNNK